MHKRIFLAFHQRLFVLLLAFSWILVGCFVTFQYDREHQYRIERVNAQLQGINRQIIELLKDGLPIDTIQRRYLSRPENLRITLITTRGAVIYDSESPAIVRRIDHSRRPEVQQALRAGEGYTLARLSHSTNEEYFYSATLHDSLVVRTALPYDMSLTHVIEADRTFLWFMFFVTLLLSVIAYLLTRGIKGQNFFRAGFFTPNLIGGIVLGYIWQFVFSRVFVSIGEATGWSLFEISWLSDPTKAFAALVIVSVWQLSGYMILIYVAGFMGLSPDVMEAADIDGASGLVKLTNIIIPLMMSSITICLFLTLSRAFMVYDVNLSLTAGAPYGTTEMAAMHVYEKAFTSRQFGVGQAEALILFVIVAIISGLQVYLTKKQEVDA